MSDSQWQQTFDYQKQRDAVSDSQWEKQYALSKKAKASSSSKKSSSKKSSKSLTVSSGNNTATSQENRPSSKEVIQNMKILAQPGNQGAVLDGISGKKFANMEALLKYYGYATAN